MKNELETFKDRLEHAGIGYDSIQVFGTIRTNIHIKCRSEKTAEEWRDLLSTILMKVQGRIDVLKTIWEAQENKGTCLKPTCIKGYLIVAIF